MWLRISPRNCSPGLILEVPCAVSFFKTMVSKCLGASPWLSGKEFTCNAGNVGDTGSVPGSGRSPGEENGTPLQYSCLEYPMDREVWWAIVHEVSKNQTRLKRLNRHTYICVCVCICICMCKHPYTYTYTYTYTHSIDIYCLYLIGVGRRFYCGVQLG